MIENKLPDIKVPAEIRLNSRDLGFVLIGLAIGIGLGSTFASGDHHVFLIILTIGLAITGTHFVNKSSAH
jgi:hypothetical protein